MKIDVVRKLPEIMDTILILHQEDGDPKKVEFLPEKIAQTVAGISETEAFQFKANELKTIYYAEPGKQSKIILCGLGKMEKLTAYYFRTMMGNVIRQAIRTKSKDVYVFTGVDIPFTDVVYGHIVAEACLLASYKFNRYLSEYKHHKIESLHLVIDTKNTRHLNRGIMEGRIFSETTILARDLVNEPANVISPETLAEHAKKAALQYGFSIDVHSMDKIRRMKMDAFLAVARGSVHEPRLIVMRYLGASDLKAPPIGLIGKGLTYDSGGYCIKTPQGMLTMKDDMGGAAAAIGAMSAIAQLKLKVNVVAIIAACENMISGDAYRAGDVIRTMSGKTVEVINTDAEGRLTLVDAIHYAIEKEGVCKIVDVATLTGAAVAALGTSFSAVLTNDEAWFTQLKCASDTTGELIWQLPAHDEYKELIKSDIADLKNTGGPWGGAITAGLFIREFVEDKPWIHIDIAGTANRDKEGGIYASGGTGAAVRLLTQFFRNQEA